MADPEIVVRGRYDGAAVDRGLSRTSSVAGRTGRAIAAGLAVGAAAATAATIAMGKASVRAASDAEQSVGATRSVYGRYAQDVIKTSRKAALAIGLSSNEYRELANVSGAMLKSTGTPLKQVATLTERLNKRGADLAATFGGTTKEAVEAIGSLLRGEADPIERYGVSIKQSDINARLAAEGLDELEGSAKKQAEAQARLAMLFEQTKDSAGQFRRESSTLAGQSQRLDAQWDNLQARLGRLLIPQLVKLAEYGNNTVMPFLNRLSRDVVRGEGSFGKAAATLKAELGPALETVGDALKDARPGIAAAAAELPSLQETARASATAIRFLADNADLAVKALPFLAAGFLTVKAGSVASRVAMSASLPIKIADVVATRQLTAATQALAAAQSGQATAARGQATAAATAVSGLGRMQVVARGAAGAAGVGALAASSQSGSKGLAALGGAASGALLGFAAGGPIGAAIGAGAGALTSLASSSAAAGEALDDARPPAISFADSLDRVSGAATRATRELALNALQESGAAESAAALGISQRDLVDALTGTGKNAARVRAELEFLERQLHGLEGDPPFERGSTEWEEWRNNINNVRSEMGKLGVTIDRDKKATRELFVATAPLSELYKGFPRQVVTRIQNNAPKNVEDVARLARQYQLTPKQIRTVIAATGIQATVKDVRGVQEQLRATGRTRADMRPYVGSVGAGMGQASRAVRSAGLGGVLNSVVSSAAASARGTASSGGSSVGGSLGSGIKSGLAAWNLPVIRQAASMIADAVAAARREAQSNSPSRKTMALGRDLGRGLEIGIASRNGRAQRRGRDLVRATLRGVRNGSSGVNRSLGGLEKLIRKKIDHKDSRVEARREREVLKGLRRRFAALRANGKAQDKVTEKLRAAREQHAGLVEASKQYTASIRDSAVAFGSVVGLGTLGDGTKITADRIVSQLRARAAAVADYRTTLDGLRASGLNQTTVQQLLDAGVEGGLATAQAIAAGGRSAITEINQLTAQVAGQGQALGASMAQAYHSAGIQAAAGLVAGLERQQAQLDRAATRMATALAKAVRKELGIKSPSTVFRGIGDDTIKGLALGLDETYVRRQGAALSKALESGYAAPRLGAPTIDKAALGGGPGGGGTQRIEVLIRAEAVSQLQQGKQMIVTLDSAFAAGARPKTRWVTG